jgi:hypothetical protein
MELYLHSPTTPPWRGAQLKHSDNLVTYFGLSETNGGALVVHRETVLSPCTDTVVNKIRAVR